MSFVRGSRHRPSSAHRPFAAQGVIALGTEQVPYFVEESPRRTRVGLVYTLDDGLVVRVPPGLDRTQVEAILRANVAWYVMARRKMASSSQVLDAWIRAGVVRWRGDLLPLVTVAGSGPTRARLEPSRVVVAGEDLSSSSVRRAVETAQERAAPEVLTPRVTYWAMRLARGPSGLRFCRPERKWGQCTAAGEITLNWLIAKGSMGMYDSVVVHELVHLVHLNHGPLFWAAVRAVMPAYDREHAALEALVDQPGW